MQDAEIVCVIKKNSPSKQYYPRDFVKSQKNFAYGYWKSSAQTHKAARTGGIVKSAEVVSRHDASAK